MLHFTNQIREHMTRNPITSSPNTSVIEAWKIMQEKKLRHIPVLDQGVVVGIVSDRNLRQAKPFAESMHLTLEDVMVTDPYCVSNKTSLVKILNEMAERKIGSAIILDQNGNVSGIFTSSDAIRILLSILDRMFQEKEFEPSMEQFLSGKVFI